MDVQDFVTYASLLTNITVFAAFFRSWSSDKRKENAAADKEEANAENEKASVADVSSRIYVKLSERMEIELDKMHAKIRILESEVQEYKVKCSNCNLNQPHHHDEINQTIILPPPTLIDASSV